MRLIYKTNIVMYVMKPVHSILTILPREETFLLGRDHRHPTLPQLAVERGKGHHKSSGKPEIVWYEKKIDLYFAENWIIGDHFYQWRVSQRRPSGYIVAVDWISVHINGIPEANSRREGEIYRREGWGGRKILSE